MQMYHTDKVDLDKYGDSYFRVCEEIIKYLNMEFNKTKL